MTPKSCRAVLSAASNRRNNGPRAGSPSGAELGSLSVGDSQVGLRQRRTVRPRSMRRRSAAWTRWPARASVHALQGANTLAPLPAGAFLRAFPMEYAATSGFLLAVVAGSFGAVIFAGYGIVHLIASALPG
jgi:hypothetical protein